MDIKSCHSSIQWCGGGVGGDGSLPIQSQKSGSILQDGFETWMDSSTDSTKDLNIKP